MPILNTKNRSFKPSKQLQIEWDTFRGGWNPLLRATELKEYELAQSDNIMLIGSGVPTGRWGTAKYFLANSTGTIRSLGTYRSTLDDSINRLVSLTDEGYLCYKDGTSFTRINGQSYPSGSIVRSEQLGGRTYFVSKDRPLSQYDGSNLTSFATISAPTGLSITNISGNSGTQIYSWKVVALANSGGTTEGSSNITLGNLPFDVENCNLLLRWTAPSAAASVITGYEVYRGLAGDETLLANVGPSVTSYYDIGNQRSESIVVPSINTTGGVRSEFIKKVGDRLVVVDASDPTKLMISGRYPNQYKFSWADGGGYAYIDPDSGQRITGIETQPGSNNIIVFKEYGSFAVNLSTVTIGNFVLLDPTYQPISTQVGCSSQDTIQVVENDVFYLGKKGVYVVGYEPNFLNLIRTNEISARIRPYLAGLSGNDYKNACSMYVDNKYILSFPSRKEMVIYDRERGCWIGPWKMPFGVSKMLKYTDENNTEKWVIGSSNNNQVYTFESSINSDDGTIITRILRTKKEYFGSWTLLKMINYFHILFRNITGSVDVNILLEDRNGQISTVKTFTIEGSAISGSTGWGINEWGTNQWGLTNGSIIISSEELRRWTQLFKSGTILQVEITSNKSNTNFELLGIKASATNQGELKTSSQRV